MCGLLINLDGYRVHSLDIKWQRIGDLTLNDAGNPLDLLKFF